MYWKAISVLEGMSQTIQTRYDKHCKETGENTFFPFCIINGLLVAELK